MARIRQIKPEFFLHEVLGELSMAHRLLFQGLWVLADKAGRLEDRPVRIKLQVLPYDAVDCEKLLADLAERAFILRYTIDGKKFIAIPSWLDHQRPHPKEVDSTIPAPCGIKKPRKATAKHVPAVESNGETGTSPSDSGFLDLGSGSLVLGAGDQQPAAPPAPAPEDKLVELWNSTADPGMPRCERLTDKRRAKAKTLLKSVPLADWPRLIAAANASDFCRGVGGKWRLSLAWLIESPENALKVLEGNYANGQKAKPDVRRGLVHVQDMGWENVPYTEVPK